MDYDVAIIGGGVTGAATLHILAKYSDVRRIILLDRYDLAQVNTHRDNNSQTLHFGDIETNYSFEKAKQVKADTELTRRYLVAHNDERLYILSHKMVLAVGKAECAELRKRYEEFKPLFPELKLIDRGELEELEPKVVQGRARSEEVIAMLSPHGYVVDYGKLARSMVKHAKAPNKFITVKTHAYVKTIEQAGKRFRITLDDGEIKAQSVVVAAGADTLRFAHRLGYGKDWILLPMAGSFYKARNLLKGKVYTMQLKKLPFAAVHGDPAVNDPGETRFGPTAKVLPMTERWRYRSILDFIHLFRFRVDAFLSLFNILREPVYIKYVLRQVLYDIPYIGTWFFMRHHVRKIIPTITFKELSYGRRLGGIRPQIVDVRTQSMYMGDAKVIGDGIVFDITPSPGASVCISNGIKNAQHVIKHLGARFDERGLRMDLGWQG